MGTVREVPDERREERAGLCADCSVRLYYEMWAKIHEMEDKARMEEELSRRTMGSDGETNR